MKNEFWPEEAGPKCTAEQAAELLDELLNGQPWGNRDKADTPAVAAVFVEELQTCPYAAAKRGIKRALREERFFPVWADLWGYIEAEWKLAGKTWFVEGWRGDGAQG